ncbi:MAG: hypothetical protein ACK559_05115, partial [bacterium]
MLVRARVLRAPPVLLDLLTRRTGRCAPPSCPPARSSFAVPTGNINNIYFKNPANNRSLGKTAKVYNFSYMYS